LYILTPDTNVNNDKYVAHKLRVLIPVHTVAEKWDCRRKRRDNGDSLTFLRQCGQGFRPTTDCGM